MFEEQSLLIFFVRWTLWKGAELHYETPVTKTGMKRKKEEEGESGGEGFSHCSPVLPDRNTLEGGLAVAHGLKG